ncbi:MAG: glutamine--fructose-6-phosphate transaminase (isomerizing) [bacterium]|nr:glutamine--fructose-6-phosphate transaminase (isomerizing) [bacterium]
MCGIFGYIGKKDAPTILIDGLGALEYRGYDSAGIFVEGAGLVRAVGPVSGLHSKIRDDFHGTAGIAHTRWATHGEPNEANAHPHSDCNQEIRIVHNGIIENYRELKEKLLKAGHKFASETDSEVIAHLIEDRLKKNGNLEDAVIAALKDVRGTYGIAIMSVAEPSKIVVARMGSPIVIGVGDGERFVASDVSPLVRHTKDVIYLEDGEIAVITASSHRLYTQKRDAIHRDSKTIEWDVHQAQKGEYDHFMLKEIMEGPEVVRAACRGRLVVADGLAKLGGLEAVSKRLRKINRLVIVGCGTAYYSGLVGEYMIEEYAGVPVEVEIASEFRYRQPILDETTAVLAISQSGETADTLAAVREAKRKGALTLGIVNTVGSTIARETDAGVYNHAGPEIGVASTKAFLSQLSVLALFTIFLGRERKMSLVMGKRIGEELLRIPEKIERILNKRDQIKEIAEVLYKYDDFSFIGRKYNFPIAYEGALKLKETSYIHAEGFGAGEMKHGPIAMIDERFPTVAIALKDSVYDKMVSNIQEIRARRGKILAIATEGDNEIGKIVDYAVFVPKTIEMLSPLLSVVPLQLLAYHIAAMRGCDVDKPRNLAKSVTVE